MKKLTIFSAPKPFTDLHIATIQRNAIRSWLHMGSDVDVLLVGEEAGMAETAKELGVRQEKDVRRNGQGTPLVSSIFRVARESSDSELFLFTNTDMLFFPETLGLALEVNKQASSFVLLGQRYDLDVVEPLDFSAGWADRVKQRVKSEGRLHPLGGSDYFLFPRHLFTDIPDFAIGRAGWDNWMIYHAVQQRYPAVDATPTITVVHQNHSYAHLGGGQGHQRHPETDVNVNLAGGMRKMYMLLDVNYKLVDGRIRPTGWNLPRLLRGAERWLQTNEQAGHGVRWILLRQLRRLRRSFPRSGVH